MWQCPPMRRTTEIGRAYLTGIPVYMKELWQWPCCRLWRSFSCSGGRRCGSAGADWQKSVWFCLYICGAGTVPHRRERGFSSLGTVMGMGLADSPMKVDSDSRCDAFGMVYYFGGAGGGCAGKNRLRMSAPGRFPEKRSNAAFPLPLPSPMGLAMLRVVTGISILWFWCRGCDCADSVVFCSGYLYGGCL